MKPGSENMENAMSMDILTFQLCTCLSRFITSDTAFHKQRKDDNSGGKSGTPHKVLSILVIYLHSQNANYPLYYFCHQYEISITLSDLFAIRYLNTYEKQIPALNFPLYQIHSCQ